MSVSKLPALAPRVGATQAVLALLGVLNVVMVGAGAYTLSLTPPRHLDNASVEKATQAAEHRSVALASDVLRASQDLHSLTVEAQKLDHQHVDYELAGLVNGRPLVIAASEPGRVGRAPLGGLAATLTGQKPDAELSLSATHAAGSTYTAYYGSLAADAGAAAPMAPAPLQPPPRKALRMIRRTVQKHLPATAASTYRIKFGDTLYKIARDHYGDETMYSKIWEANRTVIGRDRSRLPVGAMMQLPEGPGKTVDVEENVVIYSDSSVVVPGASHPEGEASASRVALRLSVPVAGRESLPLLPPRQRALVLGLVGALIAGLSWWLAALLFARQRRRGLEEQRLTLLSLVSDRLTPRTQEMEHTEVHGAWQIDHASAIIDGEDPGGSFTDVRLFSESRLGVFIGDATGSNSGALVRRGLADAFWRARASENTAPAQTLREVNRLLGDYITQGDHVTALYAQVDLMSGSVTFASAAHTGAFVLNREGELSVLMSRGLPLGIGRELFSDRLEEGHVRLQDGEYLLFLTDGILKAEGVGGEPFGVDRLSACLRGRDAGGPVAVVATIREAVLGFCGGEALVDEAAVLCLRLVDPMPAPPIIVVERGEAPAEHLI